MMFQDFESSLLHKEGYISNHVAHEVLNRPQPLCWNRIELIDKYPEIFYLYLIVRI